MLLRDSLVLLHASDGGTISERDLFSWVEHSNASVYRRDVLRKSAPGAPRRVRRGQPEGRGSHRGASSSSRRRFSRRSPADPGLFSGSPVGRCRPPNLKDGWFAAHPPSVRTGAPGRPDLAAIVASSPMYLRPVEQIEDEQLRPVFEQLGHASRAGPDRGTPLRPGRDRLPAASANLTSSSTSGRSAPASGRDRPRARTAGGCSPRRAPASP